MHESLEAGFAPEEEDLERLEDDFKGQGQPMTR
jgi:hypothetical protein